MVICPNGYAIWEKIQARLDQLIKAQGVRNAYFPLLIPESFLKKEAEHIEGFAPELAVVTVAGGKKLDENLVVRPTSETIINSMFAQWIQSYRDLPLLINQWANVVRWEMRTRLFLRTTEFLWQEGHTCHADEKSALAFSERMLSIYADFCREMLALPVVMGQKSDSERFAGAVKTFTIEALMKDGKALQAGTSHYLGTNFAKAFETRFQDASGALSFVHQTSWGVTTRLIGALIMTHADDHGFVLPPKLAQTPVLLVLIGNDKAKEALLEAARGFVTALQEVNVGVQIEQDFHDTLGVRLHRAERLGFPIRIELGRKELEQGRVILVRRDTLEKKSVEVSNLAQFVVAELERMQEQMYQKAKAFLTSQTKSIASLVELHDGIEQGGFFEANWCQKAACENAIKDQTKATIRCMPVKQTDQGFVTCQGVGPCLVCQESSQKNQRVLIARSY